MSANLSHAAQGFVNCVVVGKDIVPRLSVVNIGRLIDELVRSLSHLAFGLCAQLISLSVNQLIGKQRPSQDFSYLVCMKMISE